MIECEIVSVAHWGMVLSAETITSLMIVGALKRSMHFKNPFKKVATNFADLTR
jgi:hypothetical protein